ncbi:hypothetical protein IMG5_051070 [Ichthyophthirius multifiliis]|uniref:Uncharacterized protein n=1 Tax=Ichthyophthirius multifiliis TaxID=5932 RepID=G0QMQ4_ICHMU|nr:hypothetical protein IMG5_051070 [Ichthyophthirius multifiliis]EGR33510.1 hypothetical protein IMG5_051070 [Ichthyophthirius multifiliis]|eukprot:XP_004037496.1 hypothetical protein IMG5_051070 [Ichthyophthirius multifiliis]
MTYKIFEKILEKNGVIKISPNKGEDFNKNDHESSENIRVNENSKVAEVVQTGYKVNNKVLRQAKVVLDKCQ